MLFSDDVFGFPSYDSNNDHRVLSSGSAGQNVDGVLC